MQGFEKVVWGFNVRGCWKLNKTEIFWPQTFGHHVVSFLFFWCSTRALGSTLLGAGFLYYSYQHLLWTPTHQGPKPLWPGVAFPYHISSLSVSNSTGTPTHQARRTQLSYIIVWHPLDLWNRNFNRHQVEITVMQFRGHSLLVRQSMRVSWDFLACPILLAYFCPCDFLS